MNYSVSSQYRPLLNKYKRISTQDLEICLNNKTEENKEKLILGNLCLIAKIGNKRAQSLDEFETLFQAGIHGLIVSINKFNAEENTHHAFGTFAYRIINQEMSKCYRTSLRPVHIPCDAFHKSFKIVELKEQAEFEKQRKVTLEEAIEGTGISLRKAKTYLKANCQSLSLNVPMQEDDNKAVDFIDTIPEQSIPSPDFISDKQFRIEFIREYINNLKPLHKTVMEMRYYENKKYFEIGAVVGKTSERVRQILEAIHLNLRNNVEMECMNQRNLAFTIVEK